MPASLRPRNQTLRAGLTLAAVMMAAPFVAGCSIVTEQARIWPGYQSAPWCANTQSDYGAVRECAYFTFEQCRATVSGVGGWCERNDRVVEPKPYRKRRPARS